MDSDQEDFLSYWFSGYAKGLEQMDDAAQEVLLRACGLACGQSYTIRVFQEAWAHSANLDEFLIELSHKFPASNYVRVAENTIRISYAQCGCGLVRLGWVQSPIQCKCSAFNLQQNFFHALRQPVRVTCLSSILGGSKICEFEVSFSKETPA